MTEITLTEFGPIAEGSISVRPLTVLVGPNNSGKSYMATLLYALYRAISPAFPYYFNTSAGKRFYSRFLGDYSPVVRLEGTDVADRATQDLTKWLKERSASHEELGSVNLGDLPASVLSYLQEIIDASIQSYVESIARELTRCFGTDLGELVHSPHDSRQLSLDIRHSEPAWRLHLTFDGRNLEGKVTNLSLPRFRVNLPTLPRRSVVARRGSVLESAAEEFLVESAVRTHAEIFDDFMRDVYYLPAARSGILQSHKALAGLLVSQAPRAGIEPFNVPQLSGVVTDFIANVLQLQPHRDRPLAHLADDLQADVIGGAIQLQSDKLRYPEIVYKPSKQSIPLHRTSSMVSELAPVALYLRYIIDPHDLLIIEEPESHLYPENQLRLAKILVKLVRSNVQVLITTHSDYFLEQLNNYIKLGNLEPEQRISQGYARDEYLCPDDIAAYLFHASDKGSTVERLDVDAREGISAEQFSGVAEELYAETVRLDRQLVSTDRA